MPSLGVRLYRLFNRPSRDAGGVAALGAPSTWPRRAEGRLLWVHAPSAESAERLGPLVARLREAEEIEQVLVTCPDPLTLEKAIVLPPPAESADAVRQFLAHWRPDLGLWAEGHLRPVLIQHAGRAKIPLVLIEGRGPGLNGARWWPRLMPGVIGAFTRILVLDAHAKRLFVNAGAVSDLVEVTGPLEEPSHVLPVNEAERAALSKLFGSRPLWLAAAVPPEEEAAVAQAHLSALRMTHRLLLLCLPEDPSRAPELARELETRFGLTTASRGQDEDPDVETQVYMVDAEELGLWYRLAPVTLLGGTLLGQGPSRHPFEAAAMGSAIVHGLSTGAAAPAIDKLMRAGASRLVPSTSDLGDTVAELLAPDRAARLAQAAWGVSSAGTEASDRAMEVLTALLAGETL